MSASLLLSGPLSRCGPFLLPVPTTLQFYSQIHVTEHLYFVGPIQLLPSDITADDKVDGQSYIPAMSDAIHRPFFPTRYKETSDKWFIFT